MAKNALRAVRGLALVSLGPVLAGLAGMGCASLAEMRDLERKVGAIDRRTQGPTDQQSRVAELGAEVTELRGLVSQLRGTVEELQFSVSELREAAGKSGSSGSASSTGGGSGLTGLGTAATAGSRTGGSPGGEPSGEPGSTPSGTAAGGEVRSYEEAFRAYRAGDHVAAIDRFLGFLQTYPSSAYADNALFWLGECYLRVGDHERAVLTFEDVVKKYPNGGKVPDALYRQGVALIELGGKNGQPAAYRSAAREIFERIVRDYPDSERVSEARRQLERLGT